MKKYPTHIKKPVATQHSSDEQKAIAHIQKLKGISLSTTQAQALRESLSAYADLHALPQDFSKKSGFLYAYLSTFSSVRTQLATLLILLLISGSTGVAYAAGNSLPGQPLYALKVSVAEPIQGALITSTLGKAQWQSELTARRLEEATALATQNDLATSTQVYLQNAVESHVALAEDDANTLAGSGNDAEALQVRSALEAELATHAELFSQIAPKLAAAGDATTTGAVLALLKNVEAERKQVAFSREMTEMALAEASSTASTSAPVLGDMHMALQTAGTASAAATASSTVAATTTPGSAETQVASALAEIKNKRAAFRAVELQLLQENAALRGGEASSTATSTAPATPEAHTGWVPASVLSELHTITNQNLLPNYLQTASTSTSTDPSS